MNKLIILTAKPIYSNNKEALHGLLANPVKFRNLIINHKKKYGHKAVTKGLLRGLKKTHIKYSFNPVISSNIKGDVIVVSGADVLKYAISIKDQNRISSLCAGPNIVVHADEHNCILGSVLLDKVIVPSKWVKHAYEKECIKTKNKIVVWASGTDVDFWKPSKINKKTILIYLKTKNKKALKIVNDIKEFFNNKYEIRILNYGEYELSDYKIELDRAFLMIYFSETESQGLALQEAWSMNVPTFVWESGCVNIAGRKYDYTSPAPYLNKSNGKFFRNYNELKKNIEKFNYLNYQPRSWVSKNVTIERTANRLLRILYD